MQGLVTDRTQANVLRRAELAAKGWAGMTAEEQKEWQGSPFAYTKSNLTTYGPVYGETVSLKFTNDSIIATANVSGSYLYAVLILGLADEFTKKYIRLKADYIGTASEAAPGLALYWHSDNGQDATNITLTAAGQKQLQITNRLNRQYLALYIYVTTDVEVPAGTSVRFRGVMVKNAAGGTDNTFVPHSEIVPTDTTKGAYNYSDLNRVERAAAELSDLYGLNLETKTDWNMWDVPQKTDMLRYITNIKKIRQACPDPNAVPAAPDSMDKLNFNDANNIEKILLAASETAERVYRCGELICGEV